MIDTAALAVSLGVDGSASNDSSNLMERSHHAFFLGVDLRPASITHPDPLRWATKGAADRVMIGG